MRDFTVTVFRDLILAFKNSGYSFQTFEEFLTSPSEKVVILRHDVDRAPENSLRAAIIENELGIKGSFFFRSVPVSFDRYIISRISSLSHEIGYHYEDLSLVKKSLEGDSQAFKGTREEYFVSRAYLTFRKNLETLRDLAQVRTICMHGSPTSRWDSRLIWKYFDFSDLGLIGEPYFSLDFEKILYLTDTGRKWNGSSVSIRDKVTGYPGHMEQNQDMFSGWKVRPAKGSAMSRTEKANAFQSRYNFRYTKDIITALAQQKMPDQVMITLHPQRWNDDLIPWVRELVGQRIRNMVKYIIVRGSFLK